ncbi:hypothetical protein ACFQFC_37485 [Amorphoplanes digitatis]|uniref:Uncharacterized protein n=1 Tax=Actinoplanes digitatis TaxID=1868 RepID=A0A7W7MPX7_9ACTN|nr:hypothetical protein [Actinoplanes digitatis]MBB4761854.1 hypothetical protein [Actinoplanes digitatis]GID90965.1 hypothetical protein Adi01nite_03770 [Actinoplanes digitatis]
MRIVKLAAGFAVGYVLGTRAGRERFEQIAGTARRATSHPTVQQAQRKAKAALSDAGEAAAGSVPPRHAAAPATATPREAGGLG